MSEPEYKRPIPYMKSFTAFAFFKQPENWREHVWFWKNRLKRWSKKAWGWINGDYPFGAGDLTWESVEKAKQNYDATRRTLKEKFEKDGLEGEKLDEALEEEWRIYLDMLARKEERLDYEREFRWKFFAVVVAGLFLLLSKVFC